VVVALVVLFAWLGVQVHDGVAELSALGRGVRDAGTAVNGGFRSAGDAVGGVPFVGKSLAGALRDAGQGTGGNVAGLGARGERAVEDLANLLGWTTALVPTIVLLAGWLPWRIRRIRRLTAAGRTLGRPLTPERRSLLAMRAAFHLPYTALQRYTRDPLGDLEAGRHDALLAAAYAEVGLRPPE